MYFRLVRRTIVTVEYDSEHEIRFRRPTPLLATACSEMTSIRQVGGGDRGFLWRLNSYWRYRQAASVVVVDLESVSLSRGVPAVVRSIATPIIHHVAGESMIRTLDAMRHRHERCGQ